MSGTTPGQAACGAYRDRMERTVSFAHPLPGWGDLPDGTREAWEAAARAGTVTAWRLLDETRAERDAASDRCAGLVTEVNELRALLTVVLDDFEASVRFDLTPDKRRQFARYRELGGITGAGLPRRVPGATLREEAPR